MTGIVGGHVMEKMMASNKGTGPLATISVESTLTLIDLYRNHEALWDIRHPNYRNQNLKRASWTSIRVNFVKKTGIDCTDEHILRKLTSLRNTYTRELRLVRQSKKYGNGTVVRITTWPFYNAMHFLRGVTTPSINETESSPDSEEDTSSLPPVTQLQHTETVQPEANQDSGVMSEEGGSQEPDKQEDREDDCTWRPRRPYRNCLCKRKKKIPFVHPLEVTLQKFIEMKNGAVNQPVDALILWGRNLVETMRELKEKRRKLVRVQIDELLAQALREDLNSDTE